MIALAVPGSTSKWAPETNTFLCQIQPFLGSEVSKESFFEYINRYAKNVADMPSLMNHKGINLLQDSSIDISADGAEFSGCGFSPPLSLSIATFLTSHFFSGPCVDNFSSFLKSIQLYCNPSKVLLQKDNAADTIYLTPISPLQALVQNYIEKGNVVCTSISRPNTLIRSSSFPSHLSFSHPVLIPNSCIFYDNQFYFVEGDDDEDVLNGSQTHPSMVNFFAPLKSTVLTITRTTSIEYMKRIHPKVDEFVNRFTGHVSAPQEQPCILTLPPTTSDDIMAVFLRSQVSLWQSSISTSVYGYDDTVASVMRNIAAAITPTSIHAQHKVIFSTLIRGPSGSGKTFLASAIANFSGAPVFAVDSSSVFSSNVGDSERYLENVFRDAKLAALQQYRKVQDHLSQSAKAGLTPPTYSAPLLPISVILIDDIDVLFPSSRPKQRQGDVDTDIEDGSSMDNNIRLESRVVSILSRNLDPTQTASGTQFSRQSVSPTVVVIATSSQSATTQQILNSSNHMHLVIDLPNLANSDKVRLLEHFCSKFPLQFTRSSPSQFFEQIACVLHAYRPSDIQKLCTEAFLAALQRYQKSGAFGQLLFSPNLQGFHVNETDFYKAKHLTGGPASVLASEYSLQVVDTMGSGGNSVDPVSASVEYERNSALWYSRWQAIYSNDDDNLEAISGNHFHPAFERVVGCQHSISELHLNVLWPFALRMKSTMTMVNRPRMSSHPQFPPPARGIIFSGPSGVGKTYMALSLAKALNLPVLNLSATSLVSKLVGQSEQAVAKVFNLARASSPCVLLIDNIEAICGTGFTSETTGSNFLSKEIVDTYSAQVLDFSGTIFPTDNHNHEQHGVGVISPNTQKRVISRRSDSKPANKFGIARPSQIGKRQTTVSIAAKTEPSSKPTRTTDSGKSHINTNVSPQDIRHLYDVSNKMLSAFLYELDIVASSEGQASGSSDAASIFVIGTTKSYADLPPSLTRAGRLSFHVPLSIPDALQRYEVLSLVTQQMPVALKDNDHHTWPNFSHFLRSLAKSSSTLGFSPSDLKALCTQAAVHALRQYKQQDQRAEGQDLVITPADFLHCLPSVAPSLLPYIVETEKSLLSVGSAMDMIRAYDDHSLEIQQNIDDSCEVPLLSNDLSSLTISDHQATGNSSLLKKDINTILLHQKQVMAKNPMLEGFTSSEEEESDDSSEDEFDIHLAIQENNVTQGSDIEYEEDDDQNGTMSRLDKIRKQRVQLQKKASRM